MIWFLVLLLSAALGAAITEDIYIEEISKPDNRRSAESLPHDELVLNIVRRNGDVHKLHLRENKAINVNAPVYEAKYENGKHRAVLKRKEPIEGVRYYYDLDKKAAFQVTCEPGPRGECLREVEGVVDIDGDLYDVKPKKKRLLARRSGNIKRHPHFMKKAEMKNLMFDDITENIERKALPKKSGTGSRHKRQEPTLYTVEVVVALDHPLWAHFVERVQNKYDTSDEAVAEKEARRFYTTLVHLASLAYEGIKSQEFKIKIVISSFLFFKEETQKMIDANVYNEDGTHTEGVHFGEFLSGMYKEMRENNELPNADHVYTFTLYGAQNVAGANCLGCVCETRGWGWSTSEADELSYEARLFAHEIGHGLGLYHLSKDGYADIGLDCGDPADGYVMGSYVIGRYWEFSNCSIYELKNYLKGTGQLCLLDNADLYNIDEWNEYTSALPGQIRNITEQCMDMNNGKKIVDKETESVLCNAVTDEYFCYDMSCAGENGCLNLAAADGTPCGLPSQHKWCSASACVQKPGKTPTTTTTGDAENCYNTYAETYLGTKSTANSGYTCQRWDTDYPHSHNHDTNDKFLDASVADAANYCRDPTARGKPWCYLDKRWDYCDVPKCSAEIVNTCAEANKQYQRTLNKTRGGIPCQAWSSQSPHTHRFDSDSDFPGETIEEAGNFCRDIDNEDIAWCYTTDENKRWDYCDTKTCEDDSCYSDLIEYTGDATVTSGGIPCQRWDSNSPNTNNYLNAAEGNFCRKLDESSPWCYLGKSWDYCDISEC